jgi:hypothetical protein
VFLGKPKINEDCLTTLQGDYDIGRFDIAMDNRRMLVV